MNRKLIATGAAFAIAAGGVGVAIGAGGDDGDEQATGPAADRAREAALKLFPGGRANAVERDSEDGATWEVEVTRRDGKTVDVRLDERYELVVVEGDDDSKGDDDGEAAVSGTRAASAPAFGHPTRITNPYLPLSKYRTCTLTGTEDGKHVRVVRRLLDRTEHFAVGGATVTAAVVEDRDYADGRLVERTLDYFAQADDGTVYYLGEDVDDYKNGKVTGHHGAWRYGRDTDKLGVAMPARPRVGTTWRNEDVPGITTESDRVVEKLAHVRIRGRTYGALIRVRESISPEGETEYKLYARGTGVVRESPPDGRVELRSCAGVIER